MIDGYGRDINYLSVTDLCNLKCCYCMPAKGIAKRAQPNFETETLKELLGRQLVLALLRSELLGRRWSEVYWS